MIIFKINNLLTYEPGLLVFRCEEKDEFIQSLVISSESKRWGPCASTRGQRGFMFDNTSGTLSSPPNFSFFSCTSYNIVVVLHRFSLTVFCLSTLTVKLISHTDTIKCGIEIALLHDCLFFHPRSVCPVGAVWLSGTPSTLQARDTRPHWYPTDRLLSKGRPWSWAVFPRRQQSQHIYREQNSKEYIR